MKVLIVDFHAGCIQSLALTLEECGAKVTVLSLSQHNFIFDTAAAERWAIDASLECSIRRKLRLSGRISRSVAPTFRAVHPFSEPQFDLVVSLFPPSLAIRLYQSGIARHTLMLSAHRADLHIRSRFARKRFWFQLSQLLEKNDFHLASASVLDQTYIDSFLGEGYCELMELTAPQIAKVRLTEVSNPGTLVFGSQRLNAESRKKFLSRLKEPIHFAEECLPKKYTYEELLSYEEYAYVPYSGYSISLLELELSGRPITVPEDEDLLVSQSLNDVRLWPLYASKKRILSFDRNFRSSLNLDDEQGFRKWLQWAQWNQSEIIRTAAAGGEDTNFSLLERLERERKNVFKLFVEKVATGVVPENGSC